MQMLLYQREMLQRYIVSVQLNLVIQCKSVLSLIPSIKRFNWTMGRAWDTFVMKFLSQWKRGGWETHTTFSRSSSHIPHHAVL